MRLTHGILAILLAMPAGLACGQPREKPAPVVSDPTAPSSKIEEIMSQIRQLDQLRQENEQLRARLQDLESRLNEIAQVNLRGVISGGGDSAALLEVGGQVQLVRTGDTLIPPAANGQASPQLIRIKAIRGEAVELEVGEAGQSMWVR